MSETVLSTLYIPLIQSSPIHYPILQIGSWRTERQTSRSTSEWQRCSAAQRLVQANTPRTILPPFQNGPCADRTAAY